jgi:hypothetical protein
MCGENMSLGNLLWLVSLIIAVVVGLDYFHIYSVPAVAPVLMKDTTMSLFVAVGLALLSKLV